MTSTDDYDFFHADKGKQMKVTDRSRNISKKETATPCGLFGKP